MSVPRAVKPSVNGWNAEYLDDQYARFKADPASVSDDLRCFFQGFELSLEKGASLGNEGLGDAVHFQSAVDDLVEAYRSVGHIASATDPFGRDPETPESLTIEYHGFTEADLDRTVLKGSLPISEGATLRELLAFLKTTYCGSIGLQCAHVSDRAEMTWIRQRFEQSGGSISLTNGEKIHILEQLISSEKFETFLGKRYPGEKRFSLEGAESLIALLDRTIETGSTSDVEEFVIGVTHRGRLNILNNILGKTHEQIFTEFEESWTEDFVDGGGDVKYHRGYSGERQLGNGRTVHLSLASNPSHLESVNGVVEGRCRAKQRLRGDHERRRVVPILVHGDAAVIGQGIVAENFNLSQLDGYTTGGTIHVVVNNLIGFTTGPEHARSTRYCTDMALMIEAPVLHVNGLDPVAVVAAAQFAMEYRQAFGKDVVIDMLCFRRYGHNEQDEPSFTQPVLAGLIKRHSGVLATYAERLRAEDVLDDRDMQTITERLHEALETAQATAKQSPHDPTIDPGSKRWKGVQSDYTFGPVETAVSREMLREVCNALGTVPDAFKLNPKLKRLLSDRKNLPETGDISYADAESLAFGTLLLEGRGLRMTGQDCRRGTFSHRHAVLRDFESAKGYTPLNHMRPRAVTPDQAGQPDDDGNLTQGNLCIYDSPLSEAAVLAFEYGYSMADPNMLVMWEAQFGDFANGAQVIIDQYLASAEIKWERWSGLVLLLPHGYEGAGPEHSSARMERFLQLCGNDNMQIVYPSSAAQTFHMFRRQMVQPFRKPLIVMTPKSMLRVTTSHIDELMSGSFHEILDDPSFVSGAPRDKVTRIAFCSGKIYHELASRREAAKVNDLALVRVEQLYPLHTDRIGEIIASYPNATRFQWVQEEPRNVGAFSHVREAFIDELDRPLEYIGRARSATPAVGSKQRHKAEQEQILTEAVAPAPDADASKNGSSKKRPKTPASMSA